MTGKGMRKRCIDGYRLKDREQSAREKGQADADRDGVGDMGVSRNKLWRKRLRGSMHRWSSAGGKMGSRMRRAGSRVVANYKLPYKTYIIKKPFTCQVRNAAAPDPTIRLNGPVLYVRKLGEKA